jgi:DNA-binding MurR/RpiR family transcriptional regulator
MMLDEERIDSEEAIAALDSRGALRSLATAGAQVREALTLCEEAGIERVGGGERPRSVLVASLGGSAVVCDVLELLAEPGSPVPVSTRSNVPLPGWVGPLDLVIAVSVSGRAQGPLALAAEAGRRGAALLTVGAADSPLADVCARARGVHIDVAAGRSSSRTALWSLLTPVLLAAGYLGIVDATPALLQETADRLDDRAEVCRPSSESFVNPAKILAADLADGVPVILGDGPLNGVAATRAASMLARTARVPASAGELPDDASQIVACFDGPLAGGEGEDRGSRDIFADPFLDEGVRRPLRLIVLRDASEDGGGYSAVTDAVIAAAEDAGVRVSVIDATSPDPLLRLAHHVALTDFAATYLALGLGYDPGDSPHVRLLRDARPR